MRFQATLDLLVQLVVGDLKGVNLRPASRQQKTRPVQPGDFSGPRLRNHPARVPVDRRREMEKLRTVIERLRSRGPSDPRHNDHPLSGQWKGLRDCHIGA